MTRPGWPAALVAFGAGVELVVLYMIARGAWDDLRRARRVARGRRGHRRRA